jgi:serine/threonine protein kinase
MIGEAATDSLGETAEAGGDRFGDAPYAYPDATPTLGQRGGPLTGQTLGPITLGERVGTGGMGDVYRGHDPELAIDVAVKILPVELTASEEFARRFLREVQLLDRLSHPSIAKVMRVGLDMGRRYVISEFARGVSVAHMLAHEGRIASPRAAAIGQTVASALAHAHASGVAHGDIKPTNICVDEFG